MDSPLQYTVEKLPNVRLYYLWVWPADASVRVVSNLEILLQTAAAKDIVTVDTAFEPSGATMDTKDGYLQITLPFVEDAAVTRPAPRPQELPSSVLGLYCRCGAAVTCVCEGGMRMNTLPSKHWLEAADLWTCEVESFQQFPRGVIHAVKGRVLVSRMYVQIHPDDMREGCYKLRADRVLEGGRERRRVYGSVDMIPVDHPVLVDCTACGGNLGTVVATEEGAYTGDNSIVDFKLNTFRISTRPDCNAVENVFRETTVERAFSAELSESMEGQPCTKFAVCMAADRVSKPLKTFFRINVTNRETQVVSSVPGEWEGTGGESAAMRGGGAMVPVVKVVFDEPAEEEPLPDTPEEAAAGLARMITSEQNLERLYYTEEECRQILRFLKVSATVYPAPLRRVRLGQVWNVGFLRCDRDWVVGSTPDRGGDGSVAQ